MKSFYSSNLKIFTVLILFFPAIALGQATFSGNMNKVDGASEQTKDGLIKKCNEKNDCTGVINKNIFGVVDEEILFVPLPKITELPSDQVEEFALIEIQKHIMDSFNKTNKITLEDKIEIPVWNTTNVVPMGNMFEDASSFNQSLHSSHNNTPLSNLDGLQIQSKQKTNTEDEINQNASVIKNENNASQEKIDVADSLLTKKIYDQKNKLKQMLDDYRDELIRNTDNNVDYAIITFFKMVEEDFSSMQGVISDNIYKGNGNYEGALIALDLFTKNIQNLPKRISKALEDRLYVSNDILKSEKWISMQTKYKNKFSVAKNSSTDLFSESKKFSDLINQSKTSSIQPSENQLSIEDFKAFLKENTGKTDINLVEIATLINKFSNSQSSENYQEIIAYLNTVNGFKDFQQSITAQGNIDLDEIKKLIDDSGLMLDDLKEFLLSNKNVDLSKIGKLVNQYSKDKSLKNFAEAIKYLQSIEGFDKFINDKIDKKEEAKKELKDKSIKALKKQIVSIDFFIIDNLGNKKSEDAIILKDEIIKVLSSGSDDEIIKLVLKTNDYFEKEDIAEIELIPSAKSSSELTVMTDVSTTNETSSSNKANETKKQEKQKQQSAQKEANQNFLDSLCENGAENIEKIDSNGSKEIVRVCKNAPGNSPTPQQNKPTRAGIDSCINNQPLYILSTFIGLSSSDTSEERALANQIKNYMDYKNGNNKSNFSEDEIIKLNNNTFDWMENKNLDHTCKKANETKKQDNTQTNEVEVVNKEILVEMLGGDGTKSYGLFPMNENEKKADHHVNNDEHDTVIDKNIPKDEYSELFRNTHRHLSDTISHLLHHKLHEAHEDGLPKEYIRLLRETLDYYLASSDEMEKELEILLKIYLNDENGDLFNNKDVLNYFINTLGITIVDISTMRVIEDIILNLVERGIIDRKEFQKLIENFENYKRFRFTSKNNNNDEIIDTIIGMPDLPDWMADGLTDEEKETLEKKFKKNFNNLYILDEIMGGGPNSYPKLINYYENRKIINIKWGANWRRYWDLKNKFVEKAKEINSGVGIIKESNENTGGENHHHNEN